MLLDPNQNTIAMPKPFISQTLPDLTRSLSKAPKQLTSVPLSPSKILIPRTPISRHISYIIVLQYAQHFIRQSAHDLDCIDTRQVGAEPLPFRDPGGRGVANRDERVEDSGGAFRDGVGRVGELQEGLTVWAASTDEFLKRIRKGRQRGKGKGERDELCGF